LIKPTNTTSEKPKYLLISHLENYLLGGIGPAMHFIRARPMAYE
jgi:hypothetical protein